MLQTMGLSFGNNPIVYGCKEEEEEEEEEEVVVVVSSKHTATKMGDRPNLPPKNNLLYATYRLNSTTSADIGATSTLCISTVSPLTTSTPVPSSAAISL